jgi:hypothetical protein
MPESCGFVNLNNALIKYTNLIVIHAYSARRLAQHQHITLSPGHIFSQSAKCQEINVYCIEIRYKVASSMGVLLQKQ